MKKLTLIAMAATLALLLAACSDSLDPGDGDEVEYGFTTVDNGDGSYTTTAVVGGLSGTERSYFSFESGSTIEPVDPADSDEYDLAMLFANIYVNGGFSGTGGVELVAYDDEAYDDLDQAPAIGYITDTGDSDEGRAFNFGTIDEENSYGWYNYNSDTHLFSIVTDRYYAIQAVDGSFYKLRMTGFSTSGPSNPAELVFEWQAVTAP